MDITLMQAEQLREKANVSYAKAKEALEYSRGNMLDALIYLEDRGEIPIPQGTRYTTWNPEQQQAAQPSAPPFPPPMYQQVPPDAGPGPWSRAQAQAQPRRAKKRNGPGLFTRLRWLLLDNELEIWRRDEPVTALPFLILILLLVSLPWISIPLLIVGLFLGFRYRFSGPDLEREEINSVMGSVADSAADLGRRMADEVRTQAERYQQEQAQEKAREQERTQAQAGSWEQAGQTVPSQQADGAQGECQTEPPAPQYQTVPPQQPDPPRQTYQTVPPQAEYMTIPPQAAYQTVPPQAESMTIPPQAAYQTVPPQAESMTIPPQEACQTVPPQKSAEIPDIPESPVRAEGA